MLRRLLARALGDRLRAESLHLLVACACATLGAAAYAASGSLPPAWQLAATAFALVTGFGLLALGLIGWQPGVRASLEPGGLFVQQGARAAYLPSDAVTGCRALGAAEYHAVYRRYAAVETFATHTSALLLVETARRTVVIGLPGAAERDALHHALAACHVACPSADLPVLAL